MHGPPPPDWIAYCDGSGHRAVNPGGAGVVVLRDGAAQVECSAHLPRASNNYAEAWALGRAVTLLGLVAPGAPAVVVSDSRWALDAVNPGCTWNIRDDRLDRLCRAVRAAILRHGAVTLRWCAGHRAVPADASPALALEIQANARADTLAGLARRRGLPTNRGTDEPRNRRTTEPTNHGG